MSKKAGLRWHRRVYRDARGNPVRRMMIMAWVVILSATGLARAEDSELRDIRLARQACEKVNATDGWVGWRRSEPSFETFQYWAATSDSPPVLRTSHDIDGHALTTTSYCFRNDGSLANIDTRTEAAVGSEGTRGAGTVSRRGQVFVGASKNVLMIIGAAFDEQNRPHALADPQGLIPVPCELLALYANTDEVERAIIAELGDAYGRRPAFQPNKLDWCVKAALP
jgi:hypothetical protein